MQKINQAGLTLVKHFEGWYPNAYRDPVGIVTIGWGHTGLEHNDGTVYLGRTITKPEGEKLLKHDMGYFERKVVELVNVDLNENEFSALVSLVFNIGEGNFSTSTALKRLNAGDRIGAADAFKWWRKGTVRGQKIVLPGLVRRRSAEAELFLTPLGEIAAVRAKRSSDSSLVSSNTVKAAIGSAAVPSAAIAGTLPTIIDKIPSWSLGLLMVAIAASILLGAYLVARRYTDWRLGWR